MASRGGIEALLYLLDEACRGRGIEDTDESQGLLPNLGAHGDDRWRHVPLGFG